MTQTGIRFVYRPKRAADTDLLDLLEPRHVTASLLDTRTQFMYTVRHWGRSHGDLSAASKAP